MSFEELMKGFAGRIGAEELEADADGVRRVAVDDLVLYFREVPESDEVLTWTGVCEPPPGAGEQLYRILLEAQFMGQATQGCVLSLEAESGLVHLHRLDPMKLQDVDRFFASTEKFVDTAQHWKELIGNFRAGPAADERSAVPEDFLRV